MPHDAAVDAAIGKLIDVGVLSEEGLIRLANIFAALEDLQGAAGGGAPPAVKRGRKPGRKPGRPPAAAKAGAPAAQGKRGRRGKFNVTKEELQELYINQNLSGKEIAMRYGVSPVTVALKAKQFGLKKRGKGAMSPGQAFQREHDAGPQAAQKPGKKPGRKPGRPKGSGKKGGAKK